MFNKFRFLTATTALALTLPVTAQAADPYSRPDESWISITGVVSKADSDSFVLDYGEGLVTVEMDDWDWYGDAVGIIEGDDVTVRGRIDDDLYEVTSIEAASVYVDDLNSYFYANDADEEEIAARFIAPFVADVDLTYTGTVTAVQGRKFKLDTGGQEMLVDTISMTYNPLDDQGYQQIDKGDFVSVSGNIDRSVLQDRELQAEVITSLNRDATKNNNKS